MQHYKIVKQEIFGNKEVTVIMLHFQFVAFDVFEELKKSKLYHVTLYQGEKILKTTIC